MNASRVWWHEWLHANLSVNETKDACVFPSRPRPASRSNRPDTYQRLPLSTHNLSCETQPVHTFVPRAEVGTLFDHLVGARKDIWRDFKAECPGGLEVYDEFETRGLLDW